MSDKIVRSSGIIMNEEESGETELHVFVANLNVESDRRIKVEIFDWSNLTPVSILGEVENGTSPQTPYAGTPIEIEESTAAEFEYDITGVEEYEVRVTFYKTAHDVLVTSQGVYKNLPAHNEDENIPGQTVLNKYFTEVFDD